MADGEGVMYDTIVSRSLSRRGQENLERAIGKPENELTCTTNGDFGKQCSTCAKEYCPKRFKLSYCSRYTPKPDIEFDL